MPITKRLERRDGVVFVIDAITGKLLIAISEDFGLKNGEVMRLLSRIAGANYEPKDGELLAGWLRQLKPDDWEQRPFWLEAMSYLDEWHPPNASHQTAGGTSAEQRELR